MLAATTKRLTISSDCKVSAMLPWIATFDPGASLMRVQLRIHLPFPMLVLDDLEHCPMLCSLLFALNAKKAASVIDCLVLLRAAQLRLLVSVVESVLSKGAL